MFHTLFPFLLYRFSPICDHKQADSRYLPLLSKPRIISRQFVIINKVSYSRKNINYFVSVKDKTPASK